MKRVLTILATVAAFAVSAQPAGAWSLTFPDWNGYSAVPSKKARHGSSLISERDLIYDGLSVKQSKRSAYVTYSASATVSVKKAKGPLSLTWYDFGEPF